MMLANLVSRSLRFRVTSVATSSLTVSSSRATNFSAFSAIIRSNHDYHTTTATGLAKKKNKENIVITKTSKHDKVSSSSSSNNNNKKPIDQIREEAMRDLQVEIAYYNRLAQYDDALTASQLLLEKSMEHFGKEHPVTASAYNNIGLMHKHLGNFEDSRNNYHSALSIYKETVGQDHASYAASLNNLANLFKSQSMLGNQSESEGGGGGLKQMERIELLEASIEYFEEALNIRMNELGDKHPHTITSHSNLGSTIASLLILEHENRMKQALKENNEKGEKSEPRMKMTKFTKDRWLAAETHLRKALNTSIQNPSGKKVELPNNNEKDTNNNNSLLPRDKIQTLTSASAAQNLAVFLKTKASLSISIHNDGKEQTQTSQDPNEMYAEAMQLYKSALYVREELLEQHHPDTIATKYSLAELIQTGFNDEEEANRLRQEILDVYNVEERFDDKNDDDGGSGNVSNK